MRSPRNHLTSTVASGSGTPSWAFPGASPQPALTPPSAATELGPPGCVSSFDSVSVIQHPLNKYLGIQSRQALEEIKGKLWINTQIKRKFAAVVSLKTAPQAGVLRSCLPTGVRSPNPGRPESVPCHLTNQPPLGPPCPGPPPSQPPPQGQPGRCPQE